jgi:hypothetical protein
MNKHLAAIAAASLLAAGTPLAAAPRDDFIGTWKLVAIEMRNNDGAWAPAPLGGKPSGILTYDELGNMAVQITTDPRPPENVSAIFEFVDGYVAYFGTYEVNEAAHTVTHHRVEHNNAARRSSDAVRLYELSGDNLTLTMPRGRGFRLRWLRSK